MGDAIRVVLLQGKAAQQAAQAAAAQVTARCRGTAIVAACFSLGAAAGLQLAGQQSKQQQSEQHSTQQSSAAQQSSASLAGPEGPPGQQVSLQAAVDAVELDTAMNRVGGAQQQSPIAGNTLRRWVVLFCIAILHDSVDMSRHRSAQS